MHHYVSFKENTPTLFEGGRALILATLFFLSHIFSPRDYPFFETENLKIMIFRKRK